MTAEHVRGGVYCEDPDCSDGAYPLPPGSRRTKCKACGLRVCGWCFNHVHVLAHTKTAETGARSQVHTPEQETMNDNTERIFTITELAARWRVSRHTITAAIKAGRLQAFKPGERVYRIRESEAQRYEQQILNQQPEVA